MPANAPSFVDVWPVRIDDTRVDLAPFTALLAAEEVERASRFAFDKGRREFTFTRAALRIVLETYLGERPDAIEFVYGAHGKPRLASSTALRFNVSHSGGLALFAMSSGTCELGIDVEAIRGMDDRDDIAARFFSTPERDALRQLPERERERAFFRCWTRKEAYVKALGDGLLAPLDRFSVTLRPDEPAMLLHIDGDARAAAAWTMHDLALGSHYAGALTYRDRPREVRVMETRSPSDLLAAPP